MVQYFAKSNSPVQHPWGEPRLAYVSRTGDADGTHPRVMHAHEDVCEIVLVAQGHGLYFVDGTRYAITPGDLIIYNAGVVHDEPSDPHGQMLRYCCAIGGVQIEGLSANHLIGAREQPVRHLDDARCARIGRLMESLFEALVAGEEDSAYFLMQSLLSAVWHVLHHEDPLQEERGSALGQRMKCYIDEHYADDLSLQSIADQLNASPYYLAHIFKDMTGYSPLQYVVRRRIGEAQTLLIETNQPITWIAASVGYGNPSHFNSLFVKNVGMSPRIYRRTYTEGKQ